MWTILNRFGYHNIQEELNASTFHSLGNILTLEMVCHIVFNDLRLWLEAIPGKVYLQHVSSAIHVLMCAYTGAYLQCAD